MNGHEWDVIRNTILNFIGSLKDKRKYSKIIHSENTETIQFNFRDYEKNVPLKFFSKTYFYKNL